MTTEGKTISTVATLGMLVPILLGLLVAATPDTVLQRGDAGGFISASTSAGGFFAAAATSVQTTMGTIATYGPMSALRGQHLWVYERLKSGWSLCVEGPQEYCAPIAGGWPGKMEAAPHRRHITDWLASNLDPRILVFWGIFGGFCTFATTLIVIKPIDSSSRESEA